MEATRFMADRVWIGEYEFVGGPWRFAFPIYFGEPCIPGHSELLAMSNHIPTTSELALYTK